jgi:nucleotide-binding universal stress UspA family protein
MFPFRRITVALARSPLDEDLVRYAALLADLRRDGPLHFHFVHILDSEREAQADHDSTLRDIRQLVDARFRELRSGAFHSSTVLAGSRLDRLLEFVAENASDALLVGLHEAHRGRRSMARRLARSAPCSLWMFPEGSPVSLKRLIAAVDYSHHSAYALSTAAGLASSAGIPECTAVHVYFNQVAALNEDFDESMRSRNGEYFTRFTAPLNLYERRITPRMEASPNVAAGILRAAEEEPADVIVMGTRGLSPSLSVLLGSEAEQVIQESRLPVLVVKHRGERIGFLQALLDRDFSGSGFRFG